MYVSFTLVFLNASKTAYLSKNILKSKTAREASIRHKREKAMAKKMHKTGTLSVFGFAHNFTSKTQGAFLKFVNRPVHATCQLARDVTVQGRFRHTPRGY